jgi:hypothetical protein
MAAAAYAYLMHMNDDQIEYAAEVAMEHHLGLTCDPVQGYVQIPCIERNAMAALRAMDAAQLAHVIADSRKISFDLIVETMYQTGKDMDKKYRETSKGGLAKTSKTIKYLNDNKLEFSLVSGHITPLHFFDIIKGAGDKIVVLDDVEALIKNKDIMGLIKQACCETINDKRLVQYNSSKREVEDTAFICQAKFIMLCNKVPYGADFKAILSRAYFFNLRPSNSEIITEIKSFDKKLDAEVINFLINKCGEHTPIDFRVYQNIKEIKKLNKE